jgi:hypothetical protein
MTMLPAQRFFSSICLPASQQPTHCAEATGYSTPPPTPLSHPPPPPLGPIQPNELPAHTPAPAPPPEDKPHHTHCAEQYCRNYPDREAGGGFEWRVCRFIDLASGSGPSNGGPWFAVISRGFCRFASKSHKCLELTASTSGPAHASRNLLPPPNSVGTTSGDTHVGVEVLAAHAGTLVTCSGAV